LEREIREMNESHERKPMPKPVINPRKKKLDAICGKITMFYATETYVEGEDEARAKLSQAVQLLDQVSDLLVAADEKAAAEQPATA
jgi:hypothetical protein